MSDDGLTYRLYRCVTVTKHGSKDWAIAVTSEGHLAVRFGATGRTARLTDIPPSSFRHANVAEEVRYREDAQTRDGYEFLGEAVVRKGHLELTTPAPGGVNRGGAFDVHWEIRSPIERGQLLAALRSAVERLNAGSLPHRLEWDEARGACRVYAQTRWELGFTDAGGLTEDQRGGGLIRREHGLLPRLLLIHLQRRFPGTIFFVDAQGEPLVATFLEDDPIVGAARFAQSEVRPLIGRLGLCPGWIELPQEADDAAGAAIWI